MKLNLHCFFTYISTAKHVLELKFQEEDVKINDQIKTLIELPCRWNGIPSPPRHIRARVFVCLFLPSCIYFLGLFPLVPFQSEHKLCSKISFTFPYFLKIALGILDCLHFHINYRINFFPSKNACGLLFWIVLNLYDNLGTIDN